MLNRLKVTQKKLVEKEKFAELGHLVAGVAHEINTPIGISVTGSTLLGEEVDALLKKIDEGSLRKSKLSEKLSKIKEIARLIHNNNTRSATLVERFKELAINKDSEIRKVFSLKQMLEDLIGDMSPKTKPHHVVVNCPEILIDSYQAIFSYIFQYLIFNSIEHAFIEKEAGEITIDVDLEDDSIQIYYVDNGAGMKKEVLKNIFVPFYTTKRNQGATGLGGAIFFNIVTQILNGSVDYSSSVNQGVQIKVRIPTLNDSLKLIPYTSS